ncbi:hypothetical protein TH15_07535 [Thalassospira profundimaris]|nr:hypothetical protein TH15_07535 [Thalassospira profundimaris]
MWKVSRNSLIAKNTSLTMLFDNVIRANFSCGQCVNAGIGVGNVGRSIGARYRYYAAFDDVPLIGSAAIVKIDDVYWRAIIQYRFGN